MAYTYNMTEEDDLLDSRHDNPYPPSPKTMIKDVNDNKRHQAPSYPTSPKHMSSDRSTISAMSSSMSMKSGASGVALDARLLSHATNQATIAARSILISNGTEETALKTAKAAAQSVLIKHHEVQLSKIGPKGMFLKRKIKKQAEVVASMALVAATNAMQSNNSAHWDTNNEGPRDDDSQQPLRVLNFATSQNEGSMISSLQPPTPKQLMELQSPRGLGSSIPSNLKVDTIQEEGYDDVNNSYLRSPMRSPVKSFISTATSDQEIHRPVAIRVETRKGRGGGANYSTSSSRATDRSNHDYSDHLSDEDPIYALPNTPTSSNDDSTTIGGRTDDDYEDEETQDERSHARRDIRLDFVSVDSADSSIAAGTLDTTDTAASIKTNKTFMQANVDPFIFGFTNVFHCFDATIPAPAVTKAPTPPVIQADDTQSQVDREQSFATSNLGDDYDDDELPPSFLSESRDLTEADSRDRDYEYDDDDDRGLSRESSLSTATSYEEERQSSTRKSKLTQRMKNIIKKKGNSRRRVVEQTRSDYSDDREQYSSDSREEILDYGGSSGSSARSDSSSEGEERHSSRYRKKQSGGGFGWRSRRYRRGPETEGVHT